MSARDEVGGEPGRASPLERRFACALVGLATLVLAAVAIWESTGPILAGHYASTASVGIIADNSLRWGMLGPVWSYTAERPTAEQVYCHHPWGIFWLTTSLVAVFGRSDLVCRLAPILLSSLTPLLLYAIGARLWRPAAGAAAAITFVATPIVLSFAAFNALEVPLIAWTCLGLAGWAGILRSPEAPRRRDIAALVVGGGLAALTDWPGLITFGLVALAELGATLRQWRRGVPMARRRWAPVLLAGMLILIVAFHLLAFRDLGKLDDLLGAAEARSAGRDAPLGRVLASRRFWLEVTFTKIGLLLTLLAGPLAAWRSLATWRSRELLPLIPLAAASFQYLVFRQGADVHVFWPHTFALCVALAAAGLVATAATAIERRRRDGGGRWAGVLALAPMVGAAGWMGSDGLVALRWARESGGRFDEKGLLVHAEGDTIAALRSLSDELPPRTERHGSAARVLLHPGMRPHWAQTWSLPHPFEIAAWPPPCAESDVGAPTWIADRRRLDPRELILTAARCHLRAVGPLLVATSGSWAPIDADRFDERDPTPFEWAFVSATEPQRTRAPDPYGAWELRSHLGQPAEPPSAAPATLDEHRIAHNMALSRGDGAAATRSLAALMEKGRTLDASFDDGTAIVGAIGGEELGGPAGSATSLLVRAAGPLDRDVALGVRGRIVEPPAWRLTMRDPKPRELALPPRIPAPLWKPGWIYPVELARPRRPGREAITASFRTPIVGRRVPLPIGGAPEIELWRDAP